MPFAFSRNNIPDLTRRIGVESVQPLSKGNTTMNTYSWVKDAAERAVKTFAQAFLAALGAGAVNILSVPWEDAAGLGGGAALVSILTSVVSMPLGDKGTASAVQNGGA